MSKTSVNRRFPLPLPKGPEHESWVVDFTPMELLRKTWPTHKCPYRYTPAGQVVRRAMPWRGWVRYDVMVKRLTKYVERDRPHLNEQFNLPDDWTDEMVAIWLLAKTQLEDDTPFAIFNLWPNGRAVVMYRLEAIGSWHPDSPGRGGA
jgi:hypothetical protein